MSLHLHFSIISLNQNSKKVMAKLSDIEQKVDELQTTLDAEQLQIKATIDDLNRIVEDLRTQQADGGTPEDRQRVLDKLSASITDLASTIPDTPPVATTPPTT
jgi:ABC-type transporter Mla subunit MlaD